MQLAFFEATLGIPQRCVTDNEEHTRAVWAKPDAYIEAVVNKTGEVVLLSITTRTRWFSPTFFRGYAISDSETMEFTLGRSTFADLPGDPEWIDGSVGANRSHYDELYYFGNPGNYCRYIYGLSDAGYIAPKTHDLQRVVRDIGSVSTSTLQESKEFRDVRNRAAFNTITITAPFAEVGRGDRILGYGARLYYCKTHSRCNLGIPGGEPVEVSYLAHWEVYPLSALADILGSVLTLRRRGSD